MTPKDRRDTSLEFAQRSDQEFDNGGPAHPISQFVHYTV